MRRGHDTRTLQDDTPNGCGRARRQMGPRVWFLARPSLARGSNLPARAGEAAREEESDIAARCWGGGKGRGPFAACTREL